MIKIRRGVFETNSSSSHSISIRRENTVLDSASIAERGEDEYGYVSPTGRMYFYNSDLSFGRSPFEVLTTFYDKLRFVIASLASDPDLREEIEAVMYEVIPGLRTIEYPLGYAGRGAMRTTNYGNIDHESCGLLKQFLDKKNITIRDFLLNTKYVVWIDGDEYNVKGVLIDSGIVHKEDFELL